MEPLEVGGETRLYVRGVANVFEGKLTSVSGDALAITLIDGSSFTFSTEQIERAEVLANRRNTLKGTIVGGGVGLGVGVALVVRDRDDTSPTALGDDFGTTFDAWKLIVPPLVGAAAGALVGYVVRTPRWAPAVVPSGGASPGDFALVWSVPVSG